MLIANPDLSFIAKEAMAEGPTSPPAGLTFPAGVPHRGNDAALLVRTLMTAAPGWALGAMGPKNYDCWSMHQLVQFHIFGRQVEAVRLEASDPATIRSAVLAHRANAQWQSHKGTPRHGDAVKMGLLSNPFHIGTYLEIDRGIVLHHTEVTGLCCDNLTKLRARGYRNITYHSWIG